MGNCKSKRQDSANCKSSEPNHCDHQDPNGSQHDKIVQEQISSTHNENLSCQNASQDSNCRNESKVLENNRAQSSKCKSERQTINDTVINSTRAEVHDLLEGINSFRGTSQNDKDYKFLDEMLTRCILKLDTIECNSSRDRTNRKEAIRGVNEAISMLERKLEINTEIREVELNLQRNR